MNKKADSAGRQLFLNILILLAIILFASNCYLVGRQFKAEPATVPLHQAAPPQPVPTTLSPEDLECKEMGEKTCSLHKVFLYGGGR